MRAAVLLVIALLFAPLAVCPLLPFAAPPAAPVETTPQPTFTAPAAALPTVNISASAPRLRVGETITITGVPVNIGIPYYTLTLSSGAALTVTYYDEVRESAAAVPQDDLFEIVSAQGEMNQVTFVVRALAPGSADASIYASGEVRSAQGAFMWSGVNSSTITLTVSE